jgi:hypothetical protein
MLAVAIVSIKSCPWYGTVEALVPLAGITLFGPFTHTSDIRDRGVDVLGRGSDIARYLKSFSHESPALGVSAQMPGHAPDFGMRCFLESLPG